MKIQFKPGRKKDRAIFDINMGETKIQKHPIVVELNSEGWWRAVYKNTESWGGDPNVALKILIPHLPKKIRKYVTDTIYITVAEYPSDSIIHAFNVAWDKMGRGDARDYASNIHFVPREKSPYQYSLTLKSQSPYQDGSGFRRDTIVVRQRDYLDWIWEATEIDGDGVCIEEAKSAGKALYETNALDFTPVKWISINK